MAQNLPFHRAVRPAKNGSSMAGTSWPYMIDEDFANSPRNYVRAFLLIQQDLNRLFEFVEPSDLSATTYSFRIHELLMRTCIEVEANFKAILSENKCAGSRWNIKTFEKVNTSHHLASYELLLPVWDGPSQSFRPFGDWSSVGGKLAWYKAYNDSKHDRHKTFREANLWALVRAVGGLLVLLSSQFGSHDFSAGPDSLTLGSKDSDGFEFAIGSLFRIKYPNDWSPEELYDFDWRKISGGVNRFAKFEYDCLNLTP